MKFVTSDYVVDTTTQTQI